MSGNKSDYRGHMSEEFVQQSKTFVRNAKEVGPDDTEKEFKKNLASVAKSPIKPAALS